MGKKEIRRYRRFYGYDYSRGAALFITIVTSPRRRLFGQIVGGNYGPWFTYRTRSLYDIYAVIQHEEGHWRYSTVHPLVSSVPLMEISRCV